MYAYSVATGIALALSGLIYQIASAPGFKRHLVPAIWITVLLVVTPFAPVLDVGLLLIAGVWPLVGWLNNTSAGQKA